MDVVMMKKEGDRSKVEEVVKVADGKLRGARD